eukprot:CAMPEP_0184861554 /NCGR_PEP_ID=MMETSP0580-20130426/6213_1 /TAXON_ID=1118495 /ORGANISM="Dactyliosolen fragilissimus" /LENGTH=521 /DNA_ID=CAMNT_0027359085 /DNA_START=668 /DNA_END=2233 /DNA_ORIENTATION=-
MAHAPSSLLTTTSSSFTASNAPSYYSTNINNTSSCPPSRNNRFNSSTTTTTTTPASIPKPRLPSRPRNSINAPDHPPHRPSSSASVRREQWIDSDSNHESSLKSEDMDSNDYNHNQSSNSSIPVRSSSPDPTRRTNNNNNNNNNNNSTTTNNINNNNQNDSSLQDPPPSPHDNDQQHTSNGIHHQNSSNNKNNNNTYNNNSIPVSLSMSSKGSRVRGKSRTRSGSTGRFRQSSSNASALFSKGIPNNSGNNNAMGNPTMFQHTDSMTSIDIHSNAGSANGVGNNTHHTHNISHEERSFTLPSNHISKVRQASLSQNNDPSVVGTVLYISTETVGYLEVTFYSYHAQELMFAFLVSSLPSEKIVYGQDVIGMGCPLSKDSTARIDSKMSHDMDDLEAKEVTGRFANETFVEKMKRRSKRVAARMVELSLTECLCGTNRAAATNQPPEERYNGYSNHTNCVVDNGRSLSLEINSVQNTPTYSPTKNHQSTLKIPTPVSKDDDPQYSTPNNSLTGVGPTQLYNM